MNHLEGLNEAQKEAVLCTEGPLLVLAGAGAGKTRVITHRMLEIIRKGTLPKQILAITFTNKAAEEMRERMYAMLKKYEGEVPPRGEGPFIATFHSLGLTIIKENAKILGFARTPVVYDRSDSLRAMKEALKATGGEDIEPRAALSFVSRHKGEGNTVAEAAEKAENSRDRTFLSAWRLYERALAEDQALDFDDLLLRAVRLLEHNKAVHERYLKRFTHVSVDEYQDTNSLQARMVELLAGETKNVCAVGDIDQTIYGWRGAKIANILSFEKLFPGARIILLEENYRSTPFILDAANEVISKNIYRRDKNLYTKSTGGEKLSLYEAFNEEDEATFIVRTVQERMEKGASPRDFCVLYRANFQSRAIEEAFFRSGMPYQVVGTKFFERKEVKDVISFVRAALFGTNTDIARIANTPARGIGRATILKMLASQGNTVAGAAGGRVAQFRALLARIRKESERLSPSQLLTYVMRESGMERMYKEDKHEGAERLENVRELIALASRYDAFPRGEGLEAFLESAALASDQDELKGEANAVRLMTIHASKGLEFPFVFITGLEEGLFPYERDSEDASDKEEERRLCYVALTRAKRKVFLTYALQRTVFGSRNGTIPSQFLSDIPERLIAWEGEQMGDRNPGERPQKTIYFD